ncbi:MAG: rod shape-determining protein MreC [Acidimicrobiales bacterium]
MAAPRRSGRSRFGLFVLLLLSVTLLTLDARGSAPVERAKDGVAAVVSPFRTAGDKVFGPVGDAWTAVSENDDLEAELKRLEEQVEILERDRIEDEGAAEELAGLKAQLGLPAAGEFDTVIAEVVAGSISNFDEFVVEINRGAADGIKDGMPVVTLGGLVGRIEDTGQRNARVRLITDPSVAVAVLVVGTEEVGLMTGQGTGERLLVGNGSIRVDADVSVGDVLVTSGSDRSLYPLGLAVGTVDEIEIDEGTLEQRLLVEPSASLERLRFVTVVLYDPEAPQATGGAQGQAAEGPGG